MLANYCYSDCAEFQFVYIANSVLVGECLSACLSVWATTIYKNRVLTVRGRSFDPRTHTNPLENPIYSRERANFPKYTKYVFVQIACSPSVNAGNNNTPSYKLGLGVIYIFVFFFPRFPPTRHLKHRPHFLPPPNGCCCLSCRLSRELFTLFTYNKSRVYVLIAAFVEQFHIALFSYFEN